MPRPVPDNRPERSKDAEIVRSAMAVPIPLSCTICDAPSDINLVIVEDSARERAVPPKPKQGHP